MDIVLPAGPSVAMLFSLGLLKMPEKWDFYSDITQAVSHDLKMGLETGRWAEPVSSSAAGEHGSPDATKRWLSSAPLGTGPVSGSQEEPAL